MSEILPGDEYGVLAYALVNIQDGCGWPHLVLVQRHMDWAEQRPVIAAYRRLVMAGLIRREHGRRKTWQPLPAAYTWAAANPGVLRAARRREGLDDARTPRSAAPVGKFDLPEVRR